MVASNIKDVENRILWDEGGPARIKIIQAFDAFYLDAPTMMELNCPTIVFVKKHFSYLKIRIK